MQLPLWNFFKGIFERDYQYLTFGYAEYCMSVLISLILIALLGFIIWMIYASIYGYLDKRKANVSVLYGQLIDKRYNGEQSSCGTGTAIVPNSNGGIGVGLVSTSSHSNEEFLFFVKSDKIYKIKVNMQQYYSRNINEKINFAVTIGGLSKDELSVEFIG